MREVKFRAWDKTKNTMRKVDYIDWSEQEVGCGDGMFIPMQNCTLTQWTGLKDADGNEIYEGDIYQYEMTVVLFDNNESRETSVKKHAIVEFRGGAFMVEDYTLYDALEGDDNPIIIGNIFEYPELLQEVTK